MAEYHHTDNDMVNGRTVPDCNCKMSLRIYCTLLFICFTCVHLLIAKIPVLLNERDDYAVKSVVVILLAW